MHWRTRLDMRLWDLKGLNFPTADTVALALAKVNLCSIVGEGSYRQTAYRITQSSQYVQSTVCTVVAVPVHCLTHRLTTCPPHRPCAPQIRSQTTCPCNSCGDRKTATEGAGNASGVLFCTLMWRVEKITWLVGSIHCVSYKRYDFIADRLWYSLMKWSHEIKYPHDTNWTYMISTQILPQTNIRTSRWLLTVANRTKRWPLIVRTKEFGICLNPQQH